MRGTVRTVACGVLFVLACSGCYESRSVDRPSVVLMDGGAASDDAGTTVSRPDSGAMSRRDGGPRDAGPRLCTDPVREYEGPPCRRETLDCLGSCADDMECNACYAGDPACAECVNTTVVACANRAGCQDRWERFACCAEASGACTLELPGIFECGGGVCPGELDALVACVNDVLSTAPECGQEVSVRCSF